MDIILRSWIVEVHEQHKSLLTISMQQRAKYEGWLKFELAYIASLKGAVNIDVEASSVSSKTLSKTDIAFTYNKIRYDVELKTANTNWKIPGVQTRTRPITRNIAEIIRDGRKLSGHSQNGIAAFTLFPIPPRDRRWLDYLKRIATQIDINLTEDENTSLISIPLGEGNHADIVVVTFKVSSG